MARLLKRMPGLCSEDPSDFGALSNIEGISLDFDLNHEESTCCAYSED
jgi:hypothetical protein